MFEMIRDIPSTLEIPESLSQLERFDDDSLLLLVISDFGVASKRKVLSQWMSVEAVVGHDTSKIGVSREKDTEQIPDFALVPVGAIVETRDRGNRRRFIGIGLDSDTCVVSHTEHVVDHLESLVTAWVVDCGNVRHLSLIHI